MVEMDALPEECIAHIISLTTPRDAALCSAVSRAFRSASDSDAVWHKFLPPDLDLIVSTSSSSPPPQPPHGPSLTRKKDVFLRLCSSPLPIDSGRKVKVFEEIGLRVEWFSTLPCRSPLFTCLTAHLWPLLAHLTNAT